jgi:hypothetical protein
VRRVSLFSPLDGAGFRLLQWSRGAWKSYYKIYYSTFFVYYNFTIFSSKDQNIEEKNKVKEENNNTCKLGIFDFQTGHVFVSNPPTMFDMCLKLEPEYFDLAQTIIPFPDKNEEGIIIRKILFFLFKSICK